MPTVIDSTHARGSNGAAANGGRPAAVVVRSEGQRRLLMLEGTAAELARQVGVKRQRLSDWRSGTCAPSLEARAKMQSAFGIEAASWARLPGVLVDPPAVTPLPESPVPGTAPSTLEDCMALLAVLRAERKVEGLKPSDRVRLSDATARILSLRARLEQAQELSEDRYVYEHPAWRKLKRAILDALEPHPAAAQAVRKALAALGASTEGESR